MFRIRVRKDGKWVTHFETTEEIEAVAVYNRTNWHPKMFIGPNGIEHKQYTNNGFQWSR